LVVPEAGTSAPQAPDGLELLLTLTGSPATGDPPEVTVTVTVEVLEPSAGRLAGLALIARLLVPPPGGVV
jgi:hypothetical protein